MKILFIQILTITNGYKQDTQSSAIFVLHVKAEHNLNALYL